MDRLFSKAKFIHLKRDPRGCIKSMIDANLANLIPFTRGLDIASNKIPEILWQICETNIKEFRKQIKNDRWIDITYENLVLNTENELDKISKLINKNVSTSARKNEETNNSFDRNYAGDMKYLLQNGIQTGRGEAWKEFEELTEVSEYTKKLMES